MTHQPVAYQIEDGNGEFMCLSRTKSTIRGIASKPLYDESALEAERTARIEAQQQLADAQELAAKAGLAHMKAEPVAWMWRVADSDWQLESTRPPARPLAIVEPLYTGYMADAVAEEVAAELEACEERVVSLFEVLETPYLPDITRAIRARGTPRHNNGEHDAI